MFASSTDRWLACTFAGTLIALLAAKVAVAQDPVRSEPDAIVFSQTFLRDFYPELGGRDLTMKVFASGPLDQEWSLTREFAVQVWRMAPGPYAWTKGPDGKPKKIEDELLFGASFWIDRDGQPYRVIAGGPAITQKDKNDALRKLVDEHQAWSDEQVVEAIADSGARFGPNQKPAFQKILPLDKLEKFLGKLAIESIDFELRDQQDGRSTAQLFWVVRAQASRPAKPIYRYVLFFEPFEGRLNHIYGLPKLP